jgi:ribosome-associated protein
MPRLQNRQIYKGGSKVTPKMLAKQIAKIASDHKADDIMVLDLRKLTSFTDYFIISSGSSDRQVQAIAMAIRSGIKEKGRTPLSDEGVQGGRWALLDYGDVVTHVFYQEEREYYQLESLWHDAPRIEFKGITGSA